MLDKRMYREDVAAWFEPLITQLTDELGEVASELAGLRSRLESAERDTARIEWLESHAGLVAGDLTPETLCRDAAFGWVKVPFCGDPQRALRDAIDAAQFPSSNQGKTNG